MTEHIPMQMFYAGHMVIGHLLAKVVGRRIKYSIPLLFTATLIPDLDFAFFGIISHHTISHSLIFGSLIYVPIFLIYRSKALPYFIATSSHYLIADFVTARPALFYGITDEGYGVLFTFVYGSVGKDYFILSTFVLEFLIVVGYAISSLRRQDLPPLFSDKNDMWHIFVLGIVIFLIFVGALTSTLFTDVSSGLGEIKLLGYTIVASEHILFAILVLRGTYRVKTRLSNISRDDAY